MNQMEHILNLVTVATPPIHNLPKLIYLHIAHTLYADVASSFKKIVGYP